ncbi:hypothetical protein OS493_007409 [Desmophyllum pertusum]|uniref:D-glutamate cyclase-like C-terminal domain-containing protein n=1 Tax=Desmophyllum pertusum TaxID=174260 RepID=A0A9X0CSX3_9CNID|nr:hypothetical protein OS493_007409 [Desmophyllum pertusum]
MFEMCTRLYAIFSVYPLGHFPLLWLSQCDCFPKNWSKKTVVITAAYDAVHGAPIHIGDPSVIGIEDINKVDYGLPHPGSVVGDQIPVFWACGETPGLAVKAAKPHLFFNHDPISSMFICDATVDEYFKIHKPEHGEEQPRLVTLADQPFLASVCSASAIQKVEKLAKIVESHSGINGTIPVHGADILKIAARLSHAPSVVIGFLHEKESLPSAMSTSDGLKGALALIKALQALKKKKITIVTQYHAQLIRDCVTANAAQGISKEGIHVVEVDESCDIKERVYPGEINHRLDTMIALQVARNTCTDEDGFEGTKGGLVDTLFKEVNSWEKRIVSIKITADRRESSLAGDVSSVDSHIMTSSSVEVATCALAAALYVLNKCPIHSRYARRGIGRRQLFEVGQFLMNEVEKDGVCSQILHSIKDN